MSSAPELSVSIFRRPANTWSLSRTLRQRQRPVGGFPDKVLVSARCACAPLPGQITSARGKFERSGDVQLLSKSAGCIFMSRRVDDVNHGGASALELVPRAIPADGRMIELWFCQLVKIIYL